MGNNIASIIVAKGGHNTKQQKQKRTGVSRKSAASYRIKKKEV